MKPNLNDLIEILAQPNMGNEGRKAKLIAIKAWQINFQAELRQKLVYPTNTKSIAVYVFIKEILGENKK